MFSSYWLSFTLQVYVLFMLYVYSYWCPTHFPYHSLFNSNMMGTASGAGTGYPPDHPRSHPFFSRVHVAQSLVFCVLFCWPLFVFSFFLSFGHCIICWDLDLWYLDQFCGKRLHGTSFPHCAIKLVWICNLLYQPLKVSGHVYMC